MVIADTFHLSILGTVVMDEQFLKKLLSDVTPIRFKASVAVMVRLEHPKNTPIEPTGLKIPH